MREDDAMPTRRTFLTALGLSVTASVAPAIEPFSRPRTSHMKLSLSAYSFRDILTGDHPKLDLFQFIELAANFRADAVELTSYYFPSDADADYLHRVRQHAFLQGLDVSGTAVMNDFCVPEGPESERNLEHVRLWIDRAADLAAPFVRVMSGNWIQGTSDAEMEKRVINRLKAVLPHAVKRGVTLALENHGGGVTVTAEQLLRIVRAIPGPNFGVNLDTGNFHGPDPYAEIAAAAPFAVNVQVKTEIRRQGKSKEAADLLKVIGILREAKYSGYIALEYNAPEDPMTVVPQVMEQLRKLVS